MKPISIDKGQFWDFFFLLGYWSFFSGSLLPRLRGGPNEKVSLLEVLHA